MFNKIDDTYIFYSNAKINIFLLIGPKDEKVGLHKIYSFFLPVNLFDLIYVRKSDKFNLNYFNRFGEKLEVENCIINKINKILNIYPKLNIKIIKNIPLGSGLGGASSNAANYLKILCFFDYISKNKMLDKKFLLKIGSDVPFFMYNKPAIVYNFGEKIKFVKNFPDNLFFLSISPNFSSKTSMMYYELDNFRKDLKKEEIEKKFNNKIKNQKKMLKKLLKYDYTYIGNLENDFKHIFFKIFDIPLKNYPLNNINKKCYLSGCGSTFFFIYEDINALFKDMRKIDKGDNFYKVQILTKY
jgi:4-diphosphocytidyl-2-C-methyl-D-erythritol kinase